MFRLLINTARVPAGGEGTDHTEPLIVSWLQLLSFRGKGRGDQMRKQRDISFSFFFWPIFFLICEKKQRDLGF